MDKVEFTKIMKEINIVYGEKKFPLSNDVLNIWYKYLCDCRYEDVAGFVEHHVRTSVFPPAVSEIFNYIAEMKEKETIKSAKEREVYLSIIASYPSAVDSAEVRDIYEELISCDFQKAVDLLNVVKKSVKKWESEETHKIPSICEFLKGLKE